MSTYRPFSEEKLYTLKKQGRGGEKNLNELLSSYFKKTHTFDTLHVNHEALLAWYAIVGITEKEHTSGVFVTPAIYNQPPKLIVYVDSNSLRIDCMARREVYLQRLATLGHEFSSLEFKLSKYKKKQIKTESDLIPKSKEKYYMAPKEELTEIQRKKIDEIVETLPEAYRETGYKAILASFLRKKYK